nr:hypothetical protein Iba_chr11aCG15740 [Ipomoea batatas]
MDFTLSTEAIPSTLGNLDSQHSKNWHSIFYQRQSNGILIFIGSRFFVTMNSSNTNEQTNTTLENMIWMKICRK